MADDRWLSVEEIAEYLGVAKDSVYRWIEQKGLPAHRVGKLWKFKRSEVDTWVRTAGAGGSPSTSPKTDRLRQPRRPRRSEQK